MTAEQQATNAEKALGSLTGAAESLRAVAYPAEVEPEDARMTIAWAQAAALAGIGYAMLARLEWEQKMAANGDAAFG